MDREKSCCFSGHRSAHFDMDTSFMGNILQDALKKAICEAIGVGFTVFHSGMAIGFDIIAAEIVLQEKQSRPDGEIALVAVIPFARQEEKWSTRWRKRHDDVLRASDKIVVLNERYIRGCYHERNRYLVDNSVRLIGLFSGKAGGTAHTFKYSEKKGLDIVNLWKNIENENLL